MEVFMKRYFKNPARAQRLRENGCTVRVTRGEGDDMEIVEEYFVSPEEVQESCRRRDAHLKEILQSKRVQN
jgi:hypothetical protein